MVRKTASWRTSVDSRDVHHQPRATGKDVVVPLVLWNEPPQVEVSALHVLLLPVSQPSQNSSFSTSEYVNNELDDQVDTRTQVCVFSGTLDGVVLYWRFEQDKVSQVNMLVFPGSEGSGYAVVGICSGTDEWGQSTLISATRDGALARWQLPNGACAEGNASLAKELAPLLGLEMLCNKRFAVVVSEESRLMVLDTWRMQLLYCMDTAQEQIRRSIAVGELPVPPQKSPRARLVRSSSGSGMDTGFNDAETSGSRRVSPSRSSIAGGSTEARRIATFLPSSGTIEHTQRWDAVVLSLGAEGLVKCFLWTQPRGSTSGTAFGVSEGGGSASVAWGFRWVQRSSWVISWADQAEDITCSQSTSLKDGDNMNPQTALMGSIKNSYFPHAVHVSPDSSLVLLTWKTKFVILKRKWLCPLEIRSDGQASNEVFSKPRTNAGTGSCRIAPIEFVRQAATTYGNKYLTSCTTGINCGDVYWENGEFLEDVNVVLWTNTGHVFQFMTAESSADPAGKFFIFTKDQDQLVPRSDLKPLRTIDKAMYITSMDRCKCCDLLVHKGNCSQTKPRTPVSPLAGRRQQSGFTSCIKTGSPLSGSILQVVHMCHRGSLGLWDTPAVRMPSPTRLLQNKGNIFVATRVPPAERVRFHSLTDGFEAAAKAAQRGLAEGEQLPPSQLSSCLTHFILGRDETQSSSTYELVRRAGMRRKRRHELSDTLTSSLGGGTSITSTAAMASSVLATALAPVTGRGGPPGAGGERALPEANEGEQRRLASYRYLLDIPIIAKGFSDGMLCIGLLSQEHLPNKVGGAANDSETRLHCHSGRITAIAHSFWGVVSVSAHEEPPSSNSTQPSAEEMYFATRKNPFHRSRFPGPNLKRNSGIRHLSIKNGGNRSDRSALTIETSDGSGSNNGKAQETTYDTQPSIRFMVFTGGTDGVLRIIELILFRANTAANALVEHEAKHLQKFRNHRGPIQQISVSPLKRGGVGADGAPDWDSMYPDRLVATVGVDHKVVIYAPRYTRHPAARGSFVRGSSMERNGVEWKCVLELTEHADKICNLEWHLERGLLYVECEDRMVYVWSTDTGMLERTIPWALLNGGGNASGDKAAEASSYAGYSLVENSTLFIGNASVQLIEFGVLRSAEQLKKNWSSYYSLLFPRIDNTAGISGDSDFQSFQASVYTTGSMELFMLSLLLSWGVTPAIDESCRSILGVEPAHALYSCALQDFVSGALTIPVPWTTPIVPPLVDSSPVVQSKPTSSESPAIPASARNWQHSSALSANIALGVVSFCMSLMEYKQPRSGNGSVSPTNKEEFQVLWSQLITQHSIVLPETVAHFREPALEELAAFGFDSCEYIQLAARTLLSGVIKRLPPIDRSALSAEYSAKLHWEMVRLETETGSSFLGTVGGVGTSGGAGSSSQPSGNGAISSSSSNSANSGTEFGVMSFSLVVERLGSLVLLMSMMGTYFPGEISPAGAREVCDVLVFLLKAPERFVASVSAELLTKGLMLFRPHLVDLSSLMIQLLLIDMREKQRIAQSENGEEVTTGPGGSLANFNEGGTGGSNAAMSLLVEVGAYESAFVLGLLQQEMHNNDRPAGFHESILLYMMELVNTHYLLMCRHLPAFVDTVMACLDPTKPERRRRCLPLSTRCLHSLVRRFPMVDFHKETQRLALGTMEAVIVIYDLRTATKWRVLDGHASAVSAVRFRSDGQVLVSYAARDGSVRWWNSGNAGLFGGMLKMHQSCLKEHKLTALKESGNGGAPASTGGASAGLKQIIQTCRFHFLTRKEDASGGNSDQLKHILRLTREDASQVQFLL